MAEKRLRSLIAELESDIELYKHLQAEINNAQHRLNRIEPDTFEFRAVASLLHDVYRGAESMFLRIAKNVDEDTPSGASWHRDLLDQIERPIPQVRPPVLQSETATSLERYLSFRHVQRHIYGFELDWPLMEPLLFDAPAIIDRVVDDVAQFVAFLTSVIDTGDGES